MRRNANIGIAWEIKDNWKRKGNTGIVKKEEGRKEKLKHKNNTKGRNTETLRNEEEGWRKNGKEISRKQKRKIY